MVDAVTGDGVMMLRRDAVGYIGKEAGTDCFMTPSPRGDTPEILGMAHERGAQVLLEVHGHHSQQIEVVESIDLVYDYSLPLLVPHALHARGLEPLADWFASRPANSVTVLDPHDGIGIVDGGESELAAGFPALLHPRQIDVRVNSIHRASHGTSLTAMGAAGSILDHEEGGAQGVSARSGFEGSLRVRRPAPGRRSLRRGTATRPARGQSARFREAPQERRPGVDSAPQT